MLPLKFVHQKKGGRMISPLHASVKVLTFMVAAAVFKLFLKIIVPIISGSVNYWFVEGGSRNMLD